jgi:hypothetical protein
LDTEYHNLIKQLRDAAMKCSDVLYRQFMRDAADSLDHAILNLQATTGHMRVLNGYWAHAVRVLDAVPTEADPQPPVAGAPEVARLAA